MLAGKFEGNITNEDILELISGLQSNVKHADDWSKWVDEDEWNDAKVDAALQIIRIRVVQDMEREARTYSLKEFGELTEEEKAHIKPSQIRMSE